MSPRRPFPPIGCVYFILCWIYKRKKCWGKSNILLKMSNFWRTLLIPYKETGLLSPKIESWTTGLLLNNGFKNRTCHVEGFLRFSRIVAYKCSPSLESLRGLLTGKKKKEITGSHHKTIEAESLAVWTNFPGESEIQPGLKTPARVSHLNIKYCLST